MRCQCWVRCFIYTIAMEGEIQARKCFRLQVKCPSLSTDSNQNCTVCSASAAREKCHVTVALIQRNARYSPESTLVSNQSDLHYFWISTNSLCIADARLLRGTKSQSHDSNGRGDTSEKVVCSSSNMPVIIDQSQPDLQPFYRICGEGVFYEKSSNRSKIYMIRYVLLS
jgi:hypothetical protein